jgi:ribosomal protein S18 acetylase RimI-like enzyme
MIAVDPAYRHQGHMGRMMRALLDDVDRKKTFCMLETETPGNVPIYEHYGFRVVKEGMVEPQGVPFFFLVYDPLGIVKD